MANAYNLTGVGVFSGDDARLSSEPHKETPSNAGADPDGADATHVDEGMRLREAMKKTANVDDDGEKVLRDEGTATARRRTSRLFF